MENGPIYNGVLIMNQHREDFRWRCIRSKRDKLLRTLIDPLLPYVTYGDVTQEDADKIKEIRRRLLDLPAELQRKIDSGELQSICDYRLDEMEVLDLPTLNDVVSGEQ